MIDLCIRFSVLHVFNIKMKNFKKIPCSVTTLDVFSMRHIPCKGDHFYSFTITKIYLRTATRRKRILDNMERMGKRYPGIKLVIKDINKWRKRVSAVYWWWY